MSKTTEEEFEQFYFVEGAALRRKVEARILARHRKARNDPTWMPTGHLSGGGWPFHACVWNCMMILYKRRKKRE